MSSTSPSPDPSLVAILLVSGTRSGSAAHIAFHYPPHPLEDQRLPNQPQPTEQDKSSSSDSESTSSSDDNRYGVNGSHDKSVLLQLEDEHSPNSDGEREDLYKTSRTNNNRLGEFPWEPLLGIGEEGLVSLLAPGRAWHKRRFELGINDLTFIGRPIYARTSGRWKRRRRKRQAGNAVRNSDHVPDSETDTEHEDAPNYQARDSPEEDSHHLGEKSLLTMFNIVFVMNPAPLEKSQKVDAVYDNVVRKISKALKDEQEKSDYVLKQLELIQSIRTSQRTSQSSASATWSALMKQSSLANAIAVIYKTISIGRIAAFTLGTGNSMSLQIPPVTSVAFLPTLTEPALEPGLWLTTVNNSSSRHSDLDTAAPSGRLLMDKSFTLLLRDDVQKVTKEIQMTGGPLAPALTSFVEKVKPTKSFYKIALASQISLADIHLYAQSLLYWRRALVIPPLHHRDTYIVSPNADMSKLVDASKAFERAFPMMPAFPRFLNLLSQTPTPFGTLIPSIDHTDEYHRVLAWLMRGGWVTQLRTFAYVRVDTKLKLATREKEKEEKRIRAEGHPQRQDSDGGHGKQDRPTVLVKRPSMVSHPSSDGSHRSINEGKTKHDPSTASLIMSPLRASTEESKWLSQIADSFMHEDATSSDLSDDIRIQLRKYWPVFVKYFNGAESLESIPVREGMKRKLGWSLFNKMGLNFDRGVQNEQGINDAVLVTIRHW